MNRTLSLLAGLSFGAGLMYLLDPQGGARRRARVRDGVISASRRTGSHLGATSRDLGNRTRGLVAETASRFRKDDADADKLAARVRSAMGHAVSHPGAIEVAVDDGGVTLSGEIPSGEHGALLACVRAVRGVRQVHDRLRVREEA